MLFVFLLFVNVFRRCVFAGCVVDCCCFLVVFDGCVDAWYVCIWLLLFVMRFLLLASMPVVCCTC